MKEAAFVVTNEVRNAVIAASRNSAMVVPFHVTKTYGEELYWWKPTSESKGSLELVVRCEIPRNACPPSWDLWYTNGERR